MHLDSDSCRAGGTPWGMLLMEMVELEEMVLQMEMVEMGGDIIGSSNLYFFAEGGKGGVVGMAYQVER